MIQIQKSVQPAWGKLSTGGRRSLAQKGGSPLAFEKLEELVDWAGSDAEKSAFVASIVNAQVYIKGGARFAEAQIKARLAELGVEPKKDEKANAFLDRTIENARDVWAEMELPDAVTLLDFVWENRQEDAADENDVVILIRAKWDASQNRAAFLETFGLPAELVEADAETVVTAYKAKLAREAAAKKNKGLL